MQIYDLLLHRSNAAPCGSDTIGNLVAATGKDKLWSDRAGTVVDVVVIHCISAAARFPDHPYRLENVIPLFCEYGVSSHFLINRRGKIFRLVPEACKAWHCGGSIMPDPDNRRSVNEFSIGIELLATDKSGFSPSQYLAISRLCRSIEQSKKTPMTYVGHDQIAGLRAINLGLRSDCKTDPGPFFDWTTFFHQLDCRRHEGAISC